MRELDPQAEEGDRYLFELEAAVRALDGGESSGGGREHKAEAGEGLPVDSRVKVSA